ncbi:MULTISPECIES: ankyrin repeat domain-containing protein [unclassified Clostridium]|uniref:ankyrin repeat domain-containing protein n=1 Tax=unclassified Clostridium TaxID=2614128 RepID=UPI0002983941|nr:MULTISPECIES: ankyrin repeat domain-containing protein [unclassified Clostridium]EKQ56861.1 MAG: ankyrin repeat-containing protein [Clostridium sp. Maddingley MBC34-26]
MKIHEILFGSKPKSISRSIEKGKLDEIENFIENGGNVNEKYDDKSLLHFAIDNCGNNYFEVIELLINNGADINSNQSSYKEIPLHRLCARIRPRMDVIKLLLERGSKVNTENITGKTPIFNCNFSFSVELLNLLLSYGADIKHTDKYNNTVLHDDYILCGDNEDFEEYLKIFISHGVDINSKNNVGHTPLELCKNKYIENILIKYGAKRSL